MSIKDRLRAAEKHLGLDRAAPPAPPAIRVQFVEAGTEPGTLEVKSEFMVYPPGCRGPQPGDPPDHDTWLARRQAMKDSEQTGGVCDKSGQQRPKITAGKTAPFDLRTPDSGVQDAALLFG